MLLLRIMLFLPLVQVAPFMMPSLGDLWKLAKLGFEIGSKIKEGYDFYQNFNDDTSQKIDKILEQVAEVSNQIDGMESRLDQRLDHIVETLVARITLVQKLDSSFLELHKVIVDVDHLWDNFIEYSKNRSNFNNNTIKDFILSATGPQRGGLQMLLNQMHRLMLPLRTAHIRDSLFLTLLKHEHEHELITCDEGTTHQQIVYQIYSSVALTELRGFVMTAYAYGLRPMFEKGSYIGEVNSMEARFTMRTRDYLLATKEAMKMASQRMRRCDPKGGHHRGQSFVEMDELFQAYVINEPDMHPDNSCKDTCATIGTQTYRRKTDSYVNYNYDRPCWGRVTGCRYGGGQMTICDATPYYNNSRRYHWFKESDGTVNGDNSNCGGQMNYPKGWIRGFYKCDYCVCTCEADRAYSRAKRAISFHWSTTDFLNNMVATGVRLIQKEKMMHLQVRQGKLLPDGEILKHSDSWVPLADVQYEAYSEHGSYFLKRGKWRDLQVVGTDYAFITSDVNVMNLDDVKVPPGHVVIGVRFKHLKSEDVKKDNPIRLEVLSIPFDYATGQVLSSSKPAEWIGFEDTLPENVRDKMTRAPVKFDKPDIPTKHNQNIPTTRPNMFVKFRASDLKKDAGQSTIPFWDIQEVTTTPSFPLQGVGLFHKGHRDGFYGGYLALRLLSLDFTEYLNTTLPDDLKQSYEQLYSEPLYSPTNVV